MKKINDVKTSELAKLLNVTPCSRRLSKRAFPTGQLKPNCSYFFEPIFLTEQLNQRNY